MPSITTDDAFMAGVSTYELKLQGIDEVLERVKIVKSLGGDFELLAMAYYDGYIRRKHGLVDEYGEEVFK